jgi:hypothetical protein
MSVRDRQTGTPRSVGMTVTDRNPAAALQDDPEPALRLQVELARWG